jgi:hypothetical protein
LLAKNIETCFAGSKQAVINADAFAIFLSIFNPRTLAEALQCIGVELKWDDFGRMPAILKALGKHGSRDTAKAVEESLKRFGQMRNKIAHTGSSGIVVTRSDLDELLNFLRVFGSALVQIVEKELKEARPGMN